MKIYTVCKKELLFNGMGLLFIAVFLLFPAACTRAAKDGLNLAMYTVLPALFPFMVISAYLADTLRLPKALGRLFFQFTGLSAPCGNLFLLGLLSGFPVGASLTADAVVQKRITVAEGNHLMPLCTVCGPIFAIGILGGGMLASYRLGYALYGVQLASLLLLCVIVKKLAPLSTAKRDITPPAKPSFIAALEKSVQRILSVCGFIVFFNILCEMLHQIGILENLFPYPPLLYGLTELSTGASRIAQSDIPLRLKFSLIAALCAFSGLCVFLQTAYAVRSAGLSLRKHIAFKTVHAFLAFAVAWLIFPAVPAETFGGSIHKDSFSFSPRFLVSVYLLFLLSTLLLFLVRKLKAYSFDKRS